jgi:hypothetical protein
MQRRQSDRLQLSANISHWLFASRRLQCLPHPLGQGHVPGSCRPLNLSILRVLQNDLQSFRSERF